MNIKYALIVAISFTIIILLFSIYKLMYYKNDKKTKTYKLKRKNALTEEQFKEIFKNIKNKKNL